MTSTEHPYELTIGLNVLEHLGINLYSNIPAVLSEVVANAWDADATIVHVNWTDDDAIVIHDNGTGMTRDDINKRFLLVGYRRRDNQPGETGLGRKPMGRKGIGKLSSFSIAEEVEVETAKDGNKDAFRMEVAGIRKAIERSEQLGTTATYRPLPIPTHSINFTAGTRITLRNLKKRSNRLSADYLRRRVARRFSIIGKRHNFNVYVNGKAITSADRGYYDKIEYLWTYGNQSEVVAACPQDVLIFSRHDSVANAPFEIRGWLGTVRLPSDLKDGANENNNAIAIFMRDKIAQEDILGQFAEGGNYARYLVEELHADVLDQYDGPGTERDDDATTSSRQQIVESDPRYQDLARLVRTELKHIQSRWSDLRRKDGVDEARLIPGVAAWLDDLGEDDCIQAEEWLGNVRLVAGDDEHARRQLLQHAVLAFEEYRAREKLHVLGQVAESDVASVLTIAGDLDRVESSYYGRIVRDRVEVIHKFQQVVDQDVKEKIIQTFLFEHLWLLDPAWERADSTEVMERSIGRVLDDVDASLTQEERDSRLDIGYRTTAGKHVVVELKRSDVAVNIAEVVRKQLRKYRVGIRKALDQHPTYKGEPIEIVLVVGRDPVGWGDGEAKQVDLGLLQACQARITRYDELIDRAQRAYRDYLNRAKDVDRLASVIQAIEDFGDVRVRED